MATGTGLLELEEENGSDGYEHHYTAMDGGDQPGTSSNTLVDPEPNHEDLRPLVSPSEARYRSTSVRLKDKLKQMGEGFYSERRVVADAFIDSTKNRPQYMKDEHSSDLLV